MSADREAILDALAGCVTKAEADAALRAARRWMATHPDDLELAGEAESAAMVAAAWDLPLDQWPQADRDALLARAGR